MGSWYGALEAARVMAERDWAAGRQKGSKKRYAAFRDGALVAYGKRARVEALAAGASIVPAPDAGI